MMEPNLTATEDHLLRKVNRFESAWEGLYAAILRFQIEYPGLGGQYDELSQRDRAAKKLVEKVVKIVGRLEERI